MVSCGAGALLPKLFLPKSALQKELPAVQVHALTGTELRTPREQS